MSGLGLKLVTQHAQRSRLRLAARRAGMALWFANHLDSEEINETADAASSVWEPEVKRLQQALWDVYAALGFDTDGDEEPEAMCGDLASLVVKAAREFRADYEAALDEIPLPANDEQVERP